MTPANKKKKKNFFKMSKQWLIKIEIFVQPLLKKSFNSF